MLFKSKSIKNYKLLCTDGEFGKVKEFFFDDLHWTVRYLVADTGNWLTGKLVLISPYALLSVDNDAENISTNLSKEQIKNSPPLESHLPVSRQYESSYHDYYGYPQYWAGSMMWGALPHISRDSNDWKRSSERVNNDDFHLRSVNDMTGFSIEATDGEIGHLDDFIIDDETWAIRYLEIDTKNWGTGKKVLFSPKWIDRVGWDVSEIYVGMSRESVKQSPEYEDNMIISRDFETKLHNYYNRSGYWISEPEESHHSY